MSVEVMVERDASSALAACELQNLNILGSIQFNIHHVQGIPGVSTQQRGSGRGQTLVEQDSSQAT